MKINNKTLTFIWMAVILIGMSLIFCTAEKVEVPKEEELVEPVSDTREYYLPEVPYLEMGYSTLEEYWTDIQAKREEAKGAADEAIEVYSSVITDEQEQTLRDAEKKMLNAVYVADYDAALETFNEVTDECESKLRPAPVYNGGGSGAGGSYSGGGYNIPFNFRQMGVIYDSNYRYTYYSSRVLYHYMTPQWTLGSDGIYRDANGRVVVASDDYPQGTVVYSELFGECVVLDCGVGRSGTLDVYVGW